MTHDDAAKFAAWIIHASNTELYARPDIAENGAPPSSVVRVVSDREGYEQEILVIRDACIIEEE